MDDEPCTCRNGLRSVTEVWARQEAGISRDADLAELDALAEQQGRALQAHQADSRLPAPDVATLERMAKYRAALNTVFPCPTCRPKQFARWRHGCYRPGHIAKRCRLCKDER